MRRFAPLLLAGLALSQPTAAQSPSGEPASAAPEVVELRPTRGVTKPPSAAEWAEAPRVKLARPIPSICEARLRAEWLRLRCRPPFGFPVSGLILAGDSTDVSFYMASYYKTKAESFADVVLPLREGRRNLIQLTAADGDAPFESAFVKLSVDWPKGRDRPTVTASPTLYGGPFRGIEIATKEDAAADARTAEKKLPWDGLYITRVEPGSGAGKAGIEPFDKFVESVIWADPGDLEGVHIAFAHAHDWGPLKLAAMRGPNAAIRPFWLPIAPDYPPVAE